MRSLALLAFVFPLFAQPDIIGTINGGQILPAIAVPDLNGSGPAQSYMAAFNATLAADLEDSSSLQVRSKSLYPKSNPAQPSDVRPPDWSAPPVSAAYLSLGYGALQADQFVFRGYLVDLTPNPPLIASIYRGPVSEAGARKAAHEFAADMIRKLGGQPLYGTKIYFRSKRSGNPEIWVMDADGSNQRQVTRTNKLLGFPAISPEGDALAFVEWNPFPRLAMWSTDPARPIRFENPEADTVEPASFTADGRQIVFSYRHHDRSTILIANRDGSSPRKISETGFIDVEPKLNPKSSSIAFVSDRSGPHQIYTMNLDGGDVNRITNGEGYAENPAWHPKGEILAFAWTRGPVPGGFHIFVTGAAQRAPVELAPGTGRDDNPNWAPDGIHLVFCSTRSGTPQIWTMLANGHQLRQLTTQGVNDMPVWGR
jgi:TolB protein